MNHQIVRRFNREYTRLLGVFDKTVFDLNYSMIDMRVIGEISRNMGITANSLTQRLNIKKSYLSKILSRLEKEGYLYKEKNTNDSRVFHLYLTDTGHELNDYVDEQSNLKIDDMFSGLTEEEKQELINSMLTIEKILKNTKLNEMEEIE